MRNSHTHVVEGHAGLYVHGQKPVAYGFGKSDKRALLDAKKNGGDSLFYYFVRSNADRVPVVKESR